MQRVSSLCRYIPSYWYAPLHPYRKHPVEPPRTRSNLHPGGPVKQYGLYKPFPCKRFHWSLHPLRPQPSPPYGFHGHSLWREMSDHILHYRSHRDQLFCSDHPPSHRRSSWRLPVHHHYVPELPLHPVFPSSIRWCPSGRLLRFPSDCRISLPDAEQDFHRSS